MINVRMRCCEKHCSAMHPCSDAGVQLAFWGRMLPGEVLEMTLGLPAATLAPLGLSGLPPGYVFAIPVRGTSRQPRIDWVKCAPARAALLSPSLFGCGISRDALGA